MQVACGLGVHDEQARSRPRRSARRASSGSSTIRWASKGTLACGAAGLDDVGPEGEVGHEAPVHHVPLDAVDAGRLELRRPPRRGGRSRPGSTEGAISMAAVGSDAIAHQGHPPTSATWSRRRTLRRWMPSPLEVTRIVAGGDGIARDDEGRVVFVAGRAARRAGAGRGSSSNAATSAKATTSRSLEPRRRPGRAAVSLRGRRLRRLRLAAHRAATGSGA